MRLVINNFTRVFIVGDVYIKVDIEIRLEQESDYRAVEELTREAFWNLHVPGCDEHYLLHKIRGYSDFIPELDFVAIKDGRIVGSIVYTKSYILDDTGTRYDTITFGPISVLPQFQRQGIGKSLIAHTKRIAVEKGYKAIVIYGYPMNYCLHGFKSSKKFAITDSSGKYPSSLLVLELFDGALEGISGRFYASNIFIISQSDAEEYDKKFDYKEKMVTYTQEEFSIASNSYLDC